MNEKEMSDSTLRKTRSIIDYIEHITCSLPGTQGLQMCTAQRAQAGDAPFEVAV